MNRTSVVREDESCGQSVPDSSSMLKSDMRNSVKGYRPELDAVRFCAFLLVFFHHILPRSVTPFDRDLYVHFGTVSWHVLTAIGNACGMGLCLFFTLSAYLITSLLLEEREKAGRISVSRFYVRRVLRIWPLYIFGIAIGVVWSYLGHHSEDYVGFAWFLLFAGNIYRLLFPMSANPMTVLWSISIEEQFYLVWPWAMRWLSKWGLVIGAAIFILAANITLFVLGNHHVNTDDRPWENTLVQFEMFGLGILLALCKKRFRSSAWIGSLMVGLSLMLWFVACYSFHAKQSWTQGFAISGPMLMAGYALIALGCGCFLIGFCMLGPARMPKWAVDLGKISYGLYVYHLLVLRVTDRTLELFVGKTGLQAYLTSSLLQIPIALVVTIVIAKLSYRFLEKPFLEIKRRFEVVHSRSI